MKVFKSPGYNFVFNEKTGYFARWGKTYEDDPQYSPQGNELLDIEVTTKCNGIKGKLCPFCYKANTPHGKNMSFKDFKKILDKMPETLTQIAFGADSTLTSNPDLWKMMAYCRKKGIVPNITCADVSDKVADKLVKYCGAVAISRYYDADVCYNSIKKLTDRGMTQINMHFMLSHQTLVRATDTLVSIKEDPRLAKLNAIVFLGLKNKGRGIKGFDPLPQDDFNVLIKFCMDQKINFGFDSCSAGKFLEAVKDHENFDKFSRVAEKCESGCFSAYIDVNGKFFPCSFMSGNKGWENGIDILNSPNNFLDTVWKNKRTEEFREKLIKNDRNCPVYQI